MTAQEIYDTVLIHCRTQRVASVILNNYVSTCAYLDPLGNRCAIGCLMTLEDAAFAQDATPGEAIGILRGKVPEIYDRLDPTGEHFDLLARLQMRHDVDMPLWLGNSMAIWESGMEALADKHKLVYVPNLGAWAGSTP
jgi:hypothetical protein